MQNVISLSNSLLSSEPALSSERSLIETIKNTQPKLSMIWVKEFHEGREHLVAKWHKNN